MARQYADARRALETGISPDSNYRSGAYRASPVAQWLLARTGEKERVRRLIDYYFLLSASSMVSQPSSAGAEFDHWYGTTRASSATLGVNLPWQLFNVRHHGQWELAASAATATRLVLYLQAWRLKHGSLPASFAELMGETGLLNTYDYLTNEAFSYEPQGFDRDLLVAGSDITFKDSSTKNIIPAKQPILYSLGPEQPRGVEYIPDPRIAYHEGIRPLVYRSRNSGINQPYGASKSASQGPPRIAHPNTIRYSVFGQITDEDSLYRLNRIDQTDGEEHGDGAAAAGGAAMSSDIMIDSAPTVSPTHESPSQPPGTPDAP